MLRARSGACGGFDFRTSPTALFGLPVACAVFPNQNPAQAINMSIGSEGACTTPYRQAIAQANAGSIVVVAAGNNEL